VGRTQPLLLVPCGTDAGAGEDFRIRWRLFRKPWVCPAGLRSFWVWLRTSSSVIVSSCC
jgi:hypothetical protein